MIEIKPVQTKSDLNQFVDIPWKVYEGNQYWAPPLRMVVKEVLDVDKNPFYKHAFRKLFTAFKDGVAAGRIVGIVDSAQNQYSKEKIVFFGFFECSNDQEVANALFDEVLKWGKGFGMEKLRGPASPNMNQECGLLVDGFEDSPCINMPYNPPYYLELYENWGLKKEIDLYAYMIDSRKGQFSDRLVAHAAKVKASGKFKFREINMRKYEEESKTALDIYNDAWEANWGFCPMTEEEFRHMGKEMKMILDPRFAMFIEYKGETVAFGFALPDVNKVFQKNPGGRLTLAGIMKMIWHLKGPGRKKTVKRLRIVALGVKKKYQSFGLGPVLFAEYFVKGPAQGYPQGEASWVLETNKQMNQAAKEMNGDRYKTYRIFERSIH